MHETAAELEELQRLLDRSYERAGAHLRGIWGEDSRLDAQGLVDELPGVQVLDLATVTPRSEPRVAPVDGFFFFAATSGSAPHRTRSASGTSARTRL
ncbi:MAG TPA: hypothetical protein VNO20_11580 [Solirubrobacterales bacterium]|nr:hypothetical protein [Solirubrobacterales bacterium]